jgi:hypothetical protein
VKATTDGVVRDPSLFGITVGWPSSVVAMTEFVVPRSIPTALAMPSSRPVRRSLDFGGSLTGSDPEALRR